MNTSIKLSNGNTIDYRIVNDTFYATKITFGDGKSEDYKTSEKLINAIERCRSNGHRIRIWYGDRETGRSWNEEYDVMGRVGRSCGQIKEPLLIANSRSYGGGAILIGSVIRVDDIAERKTLYQHDNFHIEKMSIEKAGPDLAKDGYTSAVMMIQDNDAISNVANFKSEESAKRWVAFMNGERYSK